MLSSLSISNFTTVDQLHLEVAAGFVAITGETGAGKSVMLDAINLALGGRTRGEVQRNPEKPSELSVSFSLSSAIGEWLNKNGIDYSPEEDLILRRTISSDGRSRAFINNANTNLSLLKDLAPLLVEQHSQHAHHALLDKKSHSELLDDFAGLTKEISKLAEIANKANKLNRQLQKLIASKESNIAQQQLLSYQLEELVELAITEGESEQLEQELKRLSQGDSLRQSLTTAQELCSDDSNQGLEHLKTILNELRTQSSMLPELTSVTDLIDSALIQLTEANSEIDSIMDKLENDPLRLTEVEARLDKLYDISRKHRVSANELHHLQQTLEQELNTLNSEDSQVETLGDEIKTLYSSYAALAEKISKKRQSSAKKFEKAVNSKLAQLSMQHCQFKTEIQKKQPPGFDSLAEKSLSTDGCDLIEFLISTIPGKPPLALNTVASGGELSRISLAIKVVAAATKGAGTLIFDEVDVGIGGGVAEIVGELIKELSEHRQVLCVTHLAQVASKADEHCLVSKSINKKNVATSLRLLDSEERKQELARMMSGVDITAASIAQAEELLTS